MRVRPQPEAAASRDSDSDATSESERSRSFRSLPMCGLSFVPLAYAYSRHGNYDTATASVHRHNTIGSSFGPSVRSVVKFHSFSSIDDSEIVGAVGITKDDTGDLESTSIYPRVAAHWAAPEMVAPVDRAYGHNGHRHGVLGN